ncbi:TIGR02679 family protein [Nocardia cyriacigeorgica]|uniref:TIGR02679 family protein n=1 Tax=Nocardia cyriacigeorgica TaxID=135487 RepID=A0A5R8PF46_9NOCA|nr:TIGR02679 family protein [Nocardia cyriacigeorgica]TLG10917.1 TIGR02679 family protein [Nocardia cyriacigeorgica]
MVDNPPTAGTDEARLRKILGGPETEWLLARIRERMAAGKPLRGPVRLHAPSPAQRAAVDGILGRRSGTAASVSIRLEQLDAVLRDSGIHSGGLASAVTLLSGPVSVRADEAAAAERAWSDALSRGAALASQRPALRQWWERMSGRGVIRRLAGDPATAAALLDDACQVVQALPVRRELLGVFAARTLGSAHALDNDRPVATVVVAALRALAGLSDDADRRTVWLSAGLIVDELSSTVLTVGLSAVADTAAGRAVNLWRDAGQPTVLTLRQLSAGAPEFSAEVVRVCENPAVIAAAADRIGPRCPPIVCTAGQPGAAVIRLLDLLTASGSSLRYHGDFDWYGITIANLLHRRYGWQPWQFGAADYLAAIPPVDTEPLQGAAVDAVWDAELGAAMASRGVQIEEEVVLDRLLDELAG